MFSPCPPTNVGSSTGSSRSKLNVGINFVCSRSDLRYYKCTRPRFSVIAHHSERLGWHVSITNIREYNDFGASAIIDVDAKPEKLTWPFPTKWIIPLILPIIVDTPAILNKNLRQALLAYGSDTLLTDSILQEARTEVKAQLFGKATRM